MRRATDPQGSANDSRRTTDAALTPGSISLNPDTVLKTTQPIIELEQRLADAATPAAV